MTNVNVWNEFRNESLDAIDNDNTFTEHIMFSDETNFHVSGQVKKQCLNLGPTEATGLMTSIV